MLKKIWAAYFSPTGGVRSAAITMSESLGECVEEIDLSLPEPTARDFGKDDVVLFAAPVFGGRIPACALERMGVCNGNGAAAITVAVYGNRAFDDGLLELNDYIKERGFRISASVALIAEHSMSRAVATGRPDEQDMKQIADFAKQILEKLEHKAPGSDVSVPGNRPYVDWHPMPVVPLVSEACTRCGSCADQCPTQAIPKENPKMTEPLKCMLCMRCVTICPTKARTLPEQVTEMLKQKLSPLESVRRENELFL